MITLKKIKLGELEAFVKSELFLSFSDKPISKQRVLSYVKNPNARLSDVVLYMAFQKEMLIGYRTIWRDVFHYDGLTKSFGWFSGNWVHEKYRRKGVSTLLFNEVIKDWDEQLMYTNYAISSKLLYDKTNYFQEICLLKGTRFYVRFCLSDILPKKHKMFFRLKPVLKFADYIGNSMLFVRNFSHRKTFSELKICGVSNLEEQHQKFINKVNQNSLFQFNQHRVGWVLNYPWITSSLEAKQESKRYFFSVYANNFNSAIYSFNNSKGEIVGMIWLNCKEGHLKVPYVFLNKDYVESVVGFIVGIIREEKIKTVLIYNSLIENLIKDKLSYLTSKSFEQRFFATSKIFKNHPEIIQKRIHSGDGDVVFT